MDGAATQDSMPYLPFDGGRFRLSMGLMVLAEAEWLEIGGDVAATLARKRRLLATRPGEFFAALPEAAAPAAELLALLAAHLPQHHPTIYRREGERLVTSPFHLRLRQETAPQHETLERQLNLLDPELSLHRYRLVLESFHGFYAAVEDELPRLVATTPSLGFPLRARAELLEGDLLSLGLSPSDIAALPRCADLPRLSRTEHLAGCLYVLEGACLGGQIIAKSLPGRLSLTDEHGFSFFVGDGNGTGARWRLVLVWLEDLVRRGAVADEIVASARETFCSLGRWVELMGASK